MEKEEREKLVSIFERVARKAAELSLDGYGVSSSLYKDCECVNLHVKLDENANEVFWFHADDYKGVLKSVDYWIELQLAKQRENEARKQMDEAIAERDELRRKLAAYEKPEVEPAEAVEA